ncbi:MAG: CgeB family protein [Aridibacter sp.]
MRLLKLGTYYHTYLQKFYTKQFELKNQTYAVQHKELIEDCFGASDFWSKGLNKLGYETVDLIANAEFLQKTWANENDVKFDENNWLFEIATAQIKKFRPDILFIADYTTFTAEFIKNIRRVCSSIRLILGWCGAGYFDTSIFREWDIALSCIPEMVADFNEKGIRSYHINHAFAPRILDKLNLKSQPNVDFAFVGSVVKHNKFHIEREQLLIHLVKFTNLQIWADLERPSFKQRYNVLARRWVYDIINIGKNAGVSEEIFNTFPLLRKVAKWESPPNLEQFVDRQILRRTYPALFGIEMFQKLRDSRIVFNNHIDVSPVSASNMRLFETTGVGACLITDWKENISDLFEPDKEVLTYRSAEECAEKVKYLLEHEDERSAIAAAGQRRTLSEHTFDKRTARIDEIIRKSLTS